MALGLLAAVQAWIGWMRTERALRENRALPAPSSGLVIIVGVVVAVILLALGFAW